MEFETLGPYRIGRCIGHGGMGEVFEGVEEITGQRAAIKVLSPALATAEGFRDRFEAEIESLRKLRHPNIVRLYGFGEQDGYLFYSMEFVKGHSAEEELKAGRRFHWREITEVGIKLCQALKHAHDHGVIHRDLKPANVLLTADDNVKLLDFGIARLFGNNQLTSAGGVLGTADYMSPEQADGRPVTDRCDQYSLGCVMYALAAGKPPFRSNSLPELLQLQRFAEPEPVRRFNPEIPEELERIILQLLEKEPEKRFPNTQVLARRMTAMKRALSLPVEEDSFELAAERPLSEDDPTTGETRVPGEAVPSDDVGTEGYELDEASSQASIPTGVYAAAAESQPAAPIPQRRRFTTVDEEALREQLEESEPWTAVIARSAGVAVALAMVVGALWFFMRPLSSDALYEAIHLAAEDNREDSLLIVEQEIEEFLDRFPSDARAEEVAAYHEEVDLARTARSLSAKARRIGRSEGLAPIQRMYVDAIRLEEKNPEQAIAALQALIDLYEDPQTELSPERKQCLELAWRKLEQLQKRVYRYAPDQLKSIEERLARADELADTDPEQAQKMWRAVIRLFGDKPWADHLVARAESELEASISGKTKQHAGSIAEK